MNLYFSLQDLLEHNSLREFIFLSSKESYLISVRWKLKRRSKRTITVVFC